MAKSYDDNVGSMVGHITAPIREGAVKTQVVNGSPVRITRAVSGSMGQDVEVEYLEVPIVDWIPSERDIPDGGPETGFGKWSKTNGPLYSEAEESDRFPIERSLDLNEQKRIIQAAEQQEDLQWVRKIKQDPVTRVPDNWAAVDRQPDSDKFYGRNKEEAETTTVLERMQDTPRTREKVNYNTGKSMPIKFIK
jgi:hypothetical protein